MKALLYYLVIFLVLLFACKKEDEPRKSVWAGVYDDAMEYTELNPALEIVLKHDSILNVDYGGDSLDIDNDGNYDIIFVQRNQVGNPPVNDTYPYYMLRMKNEVEVASKNERYIIGHGQYSTAIWIDTIAYQTNVAAITNWSESDHIICMWAEPGSLFKPSNGPWYKLFNTERYVAIRKYTSSRYCYGWIKVKVVSHERLSFISFALENP